MYLVKLYATVKGRKVLLDSVNNVILKTEANAQAKRLVVDWKKIAKNSKVKYEKFETTITSY